MAVVYDTLDVVMVRSANDVNSFAPYSRKDGLHTPLKVVGWLFTLKNNVSGSRYMICATIFDHDGGQWIVRRGGLSQKVRKAKRYEPAAGDLFHNEAGSYTPKMVQDGGFFKSTSTGVAL